MNILFTKNKESRKINLFTWLTILLMCLGLALIVSSLYIPAKAQLAQYLLKLSWEQSQSQQKQISPWPWADSYPIARITIPKIKLDAIVLSGSSGAVLAFAPGHVHGSALPGSYGYSYISAHKDTHFINLDKLYLDDKIIIEQVNGDKTRYKISLTKIINTQKDKLPLISGELNKDKAVGLITCYPLKGIYSDPNKRLLIFAEKV